jgi:hypothetical protein
MSNKWDLYQDFTLLPADLFPPNRVLEDQAAILLQGVLRLTNAMTEEQRTLWYLSQVLAELRATIAAAAAAIDVALTPIIRWDDVYAYHNIRIFDTALNHEALAEARVAYNFAHPTALIPPLTVSAEARYNAAIGQLRASANYQVLNSTVALLGANEIHLDDTDETAIHELGLTFPSVEVLKDHVDQAGAAYATHFFTNEPTTYLHRLMWYYITGIQFGWPATKCYVRQVAIWYQTQPNYRPTVPSIIPACSVTAKHTKGGKKARGPVRNRSKSPSSKK